jgi:hypothetical protein
VALLAFISAIIVVTGGIVFKPEVSLGELLQIFLTLIVVGAFSLFPVIRNRYVRLHPMKIRHVSPSGDRRRLRLPVGAHEVTVNLIARRRRRVHRFGMFCDGRQWAAIDMVRDAVSVDSPSVVNANSQTQPVQLAGGGWEFGLAEPAICDEGAFFPLRFRIQASRAWKGRIVIRCMAGGEAHRDAILRVIVR